VAELCYELKVELAMFETPYSYLSGTFCRFGYQAYGRQWWLTCANATETSFPLTGYASLVYLYGSFGAVKELEPLRLMLALLILHLYHTSYKKAVLS
jgi:hypothetical protein